MASKCQSCNKSVYPADPQFTHLGAKYHKACFKCKECGMVLNVNKAKTKGHDLYCEKDYPADVATAVADSLHTKAAMNAPKKDYKPGGFHAAQKGTGEKHSAVMDKSMEQALNAPKKTYGVKQHEETAEGGFENDGPQYKGSSTEPANEEVYDEPAAEAEPEPEPEAAYEEPAAEEEAYEEPAAEEAYEEPAAEEAYEEPAAEGTGQQCRAMHAYEAEGDDELGFEEGDIINIIEFIDEGWWTGELNGYQGMFPATYVELIE